MYRWKKKAAVTLILLAPAFLITGFLTELLVSEGESIKLDQPLTSNPNVGGFGQGDAEIVLQDPLRVQGLLFFLASVILAQIFLVLKKKQFEKVQLYEMNF